VRLPGAHIGGQLSFAGAILTNPNGPALFADGMIVDSDANLNNGFTATGHGKSGAVRLPGAHIGGQLSFAGAILTNPDGPALVADGIIVDRGANPNGGFTATGDGELGAVRLPGAHIGGQLSFAGAILGNPDGPALFADRIIVGSDTYLNDGFTATGDGKSGTVRLPGAHIGGGLDFAGAILTNPDGPALFADGITVDSGANLNGGFSATSHGELGAVRLLGAHIGGGLYVSDEVAARAVLSQGKWVVDGLTYPGYPTGDHLSVWLKLLIGGTVSYAAQPFQQLAANARANGICQAE
jgi:hypothetical protein